MVVKLLPQVSNPMRGYAWMELGIGVFALGFPLFSSLTDSVFSLLISVESSAVAGLLVRAVLVFLLLLLPTTLMGATLPLLTEFFRRSPRHTSSWKVGLLYAANTLGAALGTMAVGFVLIELLGVLSTTLVAALLNLLIAVLAFRFARLAGPLPAGDYSVNIFGFGKIEPDTFFIGTIQFTFYGVNFTVNFAP